MTCGRSVVFSTNKTDNINSGGRDRIDLPCNYFKSLWEQDNRVWTQQVMYEVLKEDALLTYLLNANSKYLIK